MDKRNRTIFSIAGGIGFMLLAIACAQTDAGVTTKVKAKLAADTAVKATQINVDTKDKVVTLSGTVDTDAAKTEAVTVARGTEGVKDVVDNLSVAAPATAQGAAPSAAAPGAVVQTIDDAAITAAVKSKLLADTTVGGLKIDVDTKDGVVSLTGPVKSQTEKDAAVRIARETSGVKDVQANLTISGS